MTLGSINIRVDSEKRGFRIPVTGCQFPEYKARSHTVSPGPVSSGRCWGRGSPVPQAALTSPPLCSRVGAKAQNFSSSFRHTRIQAPSGGARDTA